MVPVIASMILVVSGIQCIHVCMSGFQNSTKRNHCWSPKYLQIWLCWIWNPASDDPNFTTGRSSILFGALGLLNSGKTFTEISTIREDSTSALMPFTVAPRAL